MTTLSSSSTNIWNRPKLPLDCFLLVCILVVMCLISQQQALHHQQLQDRELMAVSTTTESAPCVQQHLAQFGSSDNHNNKASDAANGIMGTVAKDETPTTQKSSPISPPSSLSGPLGENPTKTTSSTNMQTIGEDESKNNPESSSTTETAETTTATLDAMINISEHKPELSTTTTTTATASATATTPLTNDKNHGEEKTTAATTATSTTTTTMDSSVIVDMISIGSKTRSHYQTVQEATFGTHRAVRHFAKVTEADDFDQACLDLTVQQAEEIYDICKRPATYAKFPLMKRHYAPRKWLFGGKKQKNPVGWLCAQKRPLDALYQQLQRYYSTTSSSMTTTTDDGKNNDDKSLVVVDTTKLPDYLFVMDDDSWFHLDKVLPYLQAHHHPVNQADLVAGCLIRSPKDERYAFYWGGFGLILTRKVLQRLTTPIHCPIAESESEEPEQDDQQQEQHMTDDFANDQDFVAYACQRLQLDLIGERHFFVPGMSLLELIYRYGSEQPYSAAADWKPDATFCMHSDTTLAYFMQYYHVGRHATGDGDDDGDNAYAYADVDYDRIHAYRNSIKIKVQNATDTTVPVYESRNECLHLSNQDCTVQDHLCHYVTDTHMQLLFANILSEQPEQEQRYPRADAAAFAQILKEAAANGDQAKNPRKKANRKGPETKLSAATIKKKKKKEDSDETETLTTTMRGKKPLIQIG